MSDSASICPVCGNIAPGASLGQCPACLLRSGLMNLQDSGDVDDARLRPGAMIGRYRLLEEIGEGGFGIVYRAEQTEPVKRLVALKILKPGMDAREIVRRFEVERQTLALMDHPNIARVLDGGESDQGRPYFVMELVDGAPLTNHCDTARLSTRDRLNLLLDVLAAVHHAHQRGIMHRDLKPSNILVAMHEGTSVVKVIDFGIARAIGTGNADHTIFTGAGRLIGTPQYMSPEQTGPNSHDLDTRCDVYALGVVLYELLTGSTPIKESDVKRASYEAVQRLIRDTEPAKPSTRISSLGPAIQEIAVKRDTEPSKLTRQIRGDLDWIVMKALEKDRTRRYDSAKSFADDLRHFLADEPVSAGPPSKTYRLRKFAHRHRLAMTAAAATMLVLTGSAALIIHQRNEATNARDAARLEASISRAVNEFLTQDLLASADPNHEPDRDLKVRTVLDRTAATVSKRFKDQPLVEAAVRFTLASSYASLGEMDKAREHIARSLELRRRYLGLENPDTLSSRSKAAELMDGDSQKAEAEMELRTVLEARERVLGPEHRDTLMSRDALAELLMNRHDYREAETLCRNTLQVSERLLGSNDAVTLNLRDTLGNVLMSEHRHEEAAKEFETVATLSEQALGSESPLTLSALHNMAFAFQHVGKMDASEKAQQRVVEICERVFGPDHMNALSSRATLARGHIISGKYAQAEVEYRQLVADYTRVFGAEHERTLSVRNNWTDSIRTAGDPAKAETEMRALQATLNRLGGPEDHRLLGLGVLLATALQDQNRDTEAETIFRDVLSRREKAFGPDNVDTIDSWMRLGWNLKKQRRLPECKDAFGHALQGYTKLFGAAHPYTREAKKRFDEAFTTD